MYRELDIDSTGDRTRTETLTDNQARQMFITYLIYCNTLKKQIDDMEKAKEFFPEQLASVDFSLEKNRLNTLILNL